MRIRISVGGLGKSVNAEASKPHPERGILCCSIVVRSDHDD
jgi:hypothetical protein